MVWVVVASHLAALAIAVYTMRAGVVPVTVLLYAFMVDAVLRFCTVGALGALAKPATVAGGRSIAASFTQPPSAGQLSDPVRYGEGGRPAGLPIYLFMMATFAWFAFVLANVNADQELTRPVIGFIAEVRWGLVLGGVYWVNTLVTRSVVFDPSLPVSANLGHNTRAVTVLALSVLLGGLIVVVRQQMGYGASAWAVMGPLLALGAAYDVAATVQQPRDRARA